MRSLASTSNSSSNSSKSTSSSSSKYIGSIFNKVVTQVKNTTKELIKIAQDDDLNQTVDVAFSNLIARYNKGTKNTTEFLKKKAQFEVNFNKVKEFNSKITAKTKFKLGINELSDWSPEEI